jgi:hypothetical protein
VTLVELCTHLATERATLHLTVGAPELYPNSMGKPKMNRSAKGGARSSLHF